MKIDLTVEEIEFLAGLDELSELAIEGDTTALSALLKLDFALEKTE